MALSDVEIAHYHDRGYVVPEWRLPADTLAEMRAAVQALIDANPQQRPEHMVCPHLPGGATHPLNGDHRPFLAFAHMPEIVGMVRQVIGDDLILWGSQLFCKPAGDGMAIPWHQDGHYWPIRPLATCSVWVALDDSTVANGCLRVAAGSHRSGLKAHSADTSGGVALEEGLDPSQIDEADVVDLEMEAGQISLHDVFLVHGSNANRSANRRAGLVYRYMPSSSLFDRDVPDRVQSDGHVVRYSDRDIWQVSGTDAGANDVVTWAG